VRKVKKYHPGRALKAPPVATVYTIGHSTHPIQKFVDLLKHYRIQRLVDVRRFPVSRKNPQFQREALESALQLAGIQYLWMGESLGGYRKGGYLAHMQTPLFEQGLSELMALICESTHLTAVMCAELLWFRCHRRFISDALVDRGFRVFHIQNAQRVYEHRKREEAKRSP